MPSRLDLHVREFGAALELLARERCEGPSSHWTDAATPCPALRRCQRLTRLCRLLVTTTNAVKSTDVSAPRLFRFWCRGQCLLRRFSSGGLGPVCSVRRTRKQSSPSCWPTRRARQFALSVQRSLTARALGRPVSESADTRRATASDSDQSRAVLPPADDGKAACPVGHGGTMNARCPSYSGRWVASAISTPAAGCQVADTAPKIETLSTRAAACRRSISPRLIRSRLRTPRFHFRL